MIVPNGCGKGPAMCCERLVCAHCARPVVQAGCPVCRATRAQVHVSPGLPAGVIALLLASLLVLVAVLETTLGR